MNFSCELNMRVERAQQALQECGADALLVSSNVNLLYMAGQIINGYVYVPITGQAILFVRRPKGIEGANVSYIRKPEDIPAILAERGVAAPSKLAFEADFMSYSEYTRVAGCFADTELVNGSGILRSLRAVKSEYELDMMRESARKHDMVYAQISEMYHKGMSDVELSAAIESAGRKLGSLGIFRIGGSSMEIFGGSILAGENADAPSPYDFALGGAGMHPSLPIGANGTVLEPEMAIMVDMGSNFTGYMTDMSRVFAVEKITNPLALRAHQVSIDIQNEICKVAKPGVQAKALYELAYSIVEKEGLKEYFMGHNQQAGFMGHGVGIEINELPVLAPRSRDILCKGMAFAMEPKFVIPGVGAVGTENTYIVTEDGLERITHFPQEIQII
ncbi:MAG: aminopeptidase P family protein [Bacteroidales bacterium]|nr:aminopeptidase P family protein [Bacteroidales bacterium]